MLPKEHTSMVGILLRDAQLWSVSTHLVFSAFIRKMGFFFLSTTLNLRVCDSKVSGHFTLKCLLYLPQFLSLNEIFWMRGTFSIVRSSCCPYSLAFKLFYLVCFFSAKHEKEMIKSKIMILYVIISPSFQTLMSVRQ